MRAAHERLAMPNPYRAEELLTLVDGALSAAEWDHRSRLGQGVRVEDLLARLSDPGRG